MSNVIAHFLICCLIVDKHDSLISNIFQNFSNMAFSKTSEITCLKDVRRNVHIQKREQHTHNVNLNLRAIKVELFKKKIKKYTTVGLFSQVKDSEASSEDILRFIVIFSLVYHESLKS